MVAGGRRWRGSEQVGWAGKRWSVGCGAVGALVGAAEPGRPTAGRPAGVSGKAAAAPVEGESVWTKRRRMHYALTGPCTRSGATRTGIGGCCSTVTSRRRTRLSSGRRSW